MGRSVSKAEWIRRREQATLTQLPGSPRKAARVYRALPADVQWDLVEELVETRAAELCMAYRDVIAIKTGYGTRRSKKTGRRLVSRRPCVTFIVKKKWQRKKEERPERAVPKYLFSYCSLKGKRELCAIPTDVECASEYYRVRPQARRIVVKKKPYLPEKGALCCAVVHTGLKDKLFALSCRHVLSMTSDLHPRPATFSTVHLDTSQNPRILGRPRAVRGRLSNGRSLDVQLLEVVLRSELLKALKPLKVSKFATDKAQIPKTYQILAPTGRRIRARKHDLVKGWSSIPYPVPGQGTIFPRHDLLLQSTVDFDAAVGGDSGAPVVTSDGTMLLGMHIAGGGTMAFAIPAWKLFETELWSGISKKETIGPLFNP